MVKIWNLCPKTKTSAGDNGDEDNNSSSDDDKSTEIFQLFLHGYMLIMEDFWHTNKIRHCFLV